jgi:hypothetical protein
VRSDDDSELKQIFDEAHGAFDPVPAAFAATLRAARLRGAPRPAPAPRRLRTLAGAALFTAALAVAVDLGRRDAPDTTDALRLASSLESWRAPTDFLERLPGEELLGVPAIAPPGAFESAP